MPVSKERFAQGMTYAEFREQMTRNRERFEENERTVKFTPEDLAFFKQLPEPLSVVVLAEDWCGDVINNLPILGRLAEESGKLDLRIFLRDQNLDIMDQYLKDGQYRSIPTFIFYDAAWRELGHWIERPAKVNEMLAAMRRELFAHDPLLAGFSPDTPFAQLPEEARNRLREANAAFREQNRALFDSEVVREIRALLEHGVAQPASSQPQVVVPLAPADQARRANGKEPLKVSITYCAECGYEPQTLSLAEALMKTFVSDLASIELIPWHDGAFDVVVGGDLVHSMYRDGGFPEHETIINAIRQRMAAS